MRNANLIVEIDKSGLKLKQISRDSGIDYQRLCRLYRGDVNLTAIDIMKLQPVLKIDAGRLIG